jgi:hypothetical protein
LGLAWVQEPDNIRLYNDLPTEGRSEKLKGERK